MIFEIANKVNANLIWHKIAIRRLPGKCDLHRPTFSHMLAFNGKPKKVTPDVFERGKPVYSNGTGTNAAMIGVEWISGQSERIVDPFCGVETIPATAEILGINSIGIDIDSDQCKKAKMLRFLS